MTHTNQRKIGFLMARYKTLITIILIMAGAAFLIGLTYIIPMYLLRSDENKAISTDTNSVAKPTVPNQTSSHENDLGPMIVIQPFQRTVTSEGKRELEIKANRATIDQKARMFNLEEVNEVAFWGEDNEKVTVRADSGTWDQQRNVVRVQDNIQALIEMPDREPIKVSAQWLEYDNELAQLQGGSQIKIVHGPYLATGKRLRLRQRISHIELEDSVHVEIEPKAFNHHKFFDELITIECGILQYSGKDQILQFDNNPIITSKKSIMAAKKITLFNEAEKLKIIWSGGCHFLIYLPDNNVPVMIEAKEITYDESAGSLTLEKSITVEHENRSITASDQLIVMLNPETEDILGMQAYGNVSFEDDEASGKAESLLWDALNEVVIFQGDASLENRKDTSLFADQIQLQIEKAFYSAEGHVKVRISNDQDSPVENTPPSFFLGGFSSNSPDQTGEMVLNADLLDIDERLGFMYFIGNVHGTRGTASFSMEKLDIRFDPDTHRLMEMTAQKSVVLTDQDRLLTSDYLYHNALTTHTEVLENPVLWHGETQIRADRFDYNETQKNLEMSGNVEVVTMVGDSLSIDSTSVEPNDMKNRLVYLTAGSGFYNETTGKLEFQDNVTMRKEDWVVQSQSTQLYFDDESGELVDMDARDNIQIKHPLFEATGHSLTYSPETSILVLRGTDTQKCRVIQGDRGTEGELVRFFTDENRVAIEKGTSVILPSEIVETTQ